MNALDAAAISIVSLLSQKSAFLNQLLVTISNNDLFKGIPAMTAFFYLFFSSTATSETDSNDDQRRLRRILLKTLAGAFLALFLGRALQMGLPFRARPMNASDFVFPLPIGTEKKMEHWSSFPSDHLALFISLATGYFFANRRLGLVFLGWCAVVIGLPRIYLGLHYATDVLAGGLLGAACTILMQKATFLDNWCDRLDSYSKNYPALFYALMFLACFEIATLFDSLRELGSFLHHGQIE